MKKNTPVFPSNIIDIKFSGNRAYVLKEINLTSLEVENQLQKLKYTGQGRKILEITENEKFPPFALAFFKLLFRINRIPSEEELIDFYQNQFFCKTPTGEIVCNFENRLIKVDSESFKGRILRSYPSFIRDYHFFLKCTESNYFDKVIYSLKEDYFEGIDITVFSDSLKKHISLHTNTARGKNYKIKKLGRHDYSNKNEIILEINLSKSSKKVSNFYLYPDRVVEDLIEKVEEEKANYIVSKI